MMYDSIDYSYIIQAIANKYIYITFPSQIPKISGKDAFVSTLNTFLYEPFLGIFTVRFINTFVVYSVHTVKSFL